jgi:hypothetical protein
MQVPLREDKNFSTLFKQKCHKPKAKYPTTNNTKIKGVFKMTNTNQELVNTLAMGIITSQDEELKDLYYTSLFEELEGWIKARAYKKYQSVKGYGGTYEDVVGMFHDSIQAVLEGKAFTKYDGTKGDFVSVVYKQVRNPLKDYMYYLQADKRAVNNEGDSLNATMNDDASNTLGDMVEDGSVDIGLSVTDSVYLSNLLDEFSKVTKNGEAKSKAIYCHLYKELYDGQDIAEAFGHDSYDDSARQKLNRAKKEFKKFLLSQTGEKFPN